MRWISLRATESNSSLATCICRSLHFVREPHTVLVHGESAFLGVAVAYDTMPKISNGLQNLCKPMHLQRWRVRPLIFMLQDGTLAAGHVKDRTKNQTRLTCLGCCNATKSHKEPFRIILKSQHCPCFYKWKRRRTGLWLPCYINAWTKTSLGFEWHHCLTVMLTPKRRKLS